MSISLFQQNLEEGLGLIEYGSAVGDKNAFKAAYHVKSYFCT